MATPSYGLNTWVGIGEESTWGTAVSRTKWFEATNIGVRHEKRIAFSQVVRGLDPQRQYTQLERASGDLTLELQYAGYLKLFKHLMFGVTTSTVTTGVYRHEFSRTDTSGTAAALTTGLTVEANLDQQNWLYTGMRISQASFSMKPDAYLTGTFSMVGKGGSINSTVSTPTYPSDLPILPSQGVVTFGATDMSDHVQGIELVVGNALDGERRRIGSTYPKEAVRSGDRPDISLNLDLEYNNTTDDLLTDWLAGTAKDITIAYTGATITGTHSYVFKAELPNCVIMGDAPTVSSSGVIPLRFSVRPLTATAGAFDVNSGATGALRFTFINAESSI